MSSLPSVVMLGLFYLICDRDTQLGGCLQQLFDPIHEMTAEAGKKHSSQIQLTLQ